MAASFFWFVRCANVRATPQPIAVEREDAMAAGGTTGACLVSRKVLDLAAARQLRPQQKPGRGRCCASGRVPVSRTIYAAVQFGGGEHRIEARCDRCRLRAGCVGHEPGTGQPQGGG